MMSMEKPFALGDKTGPRMQEGLMKTRGMPSSAAHLCASGSAKICGLHNYSFFPTAFAQQCHRLKVEKMAGMSVNGGNLYRDMTADIQCAVRTV